MEGHMNLIKYINNLFECSKNQIGFYKSQMNLQENKNINSQININTENDEDNLYKFIDKIVNEITNESHLIENNDIII